MFNTSFRRLLATVLAAALIGIAIGNGFAQIKLPAAEDIQQLIFAGRRDDALALARKMLEDADRAGRPKERADALQVLGDVHRSRGEYHEAARNYSAALELREKTFGTSSIEVAATLDAMVHNYEAVGDLAASRDAAKRSYEIRSSSYKEDGCTIARVAGSVPNADCELTGTILNTKLTEQEFKAPIEAVQVLFGTDRKRQDIKLPKGDTRVSYGPDRGGELRLGMASITVPRNHASGKIERPWTLTLTGVKFYSQAENPNQHFVVGEIREVSEDGLLAEARKRLAGAQRFKGQALVFLHGYNVTFEDALFRTAQITYDLRFDGAPFLFSWPSKGSAVSYNLDTNSARQSELHFERFLATVMQRSGAEQVHVVAHSMGNQILLAALDKLSRGGTRSPLGEVILAAPDVDRDVFRNAVKQIAPAVRGLTLYVSNTDRAMHASRVWNGAPRAGDHPPTGPLVTAGLDTIDTSAISNDALSLNHSSYGSSVWLINDMASLMLAGKRPPGDRTPILRSIPAEGGTFWKFPPM